MAKGSVQLKTEIYISNKLRPFIVNTTRTLELVNKFEMVPPTKELFNNFELKFLRDGNTHADNEHREKIAREREE